MRFSRFPRVVVEETVPSARRVAAARRAVQADKDRWALLPQFVTHQTAEERLAAIDRHRAEYWVELRQHRAHEWRRARRELRELPAIRQAGLRRYWQQFRCPGDPVYLLTLIRDARKGVSFWARLSYLRRLTLVGLGKLPRPAQWR